ncbi:MAG: DUF2953 domain-containing protein [Syntrophomonadaceae bacterium]|jgi:hypothetical protein|nr:DUF2953 domain-containing protein [Syntrophomonadaceae bacterium]
MIYIIFGLLLLLLLFLIILIEFQLQVVYDQDQSQIRITWQFLRFIQGQHSIATQWMKYILSRPTGHSSSKLEFAQSLHALKRFYKYLKYISIYELKWYTVIGTGDAMYTALGCGSMWSLKGMLIARITKVGMSQNIAINIQPDFEKQRIYSELNCIFKLRMVHIMLIGFNIIWLKIRRYINGYTAAGKPQPSH